MLDGMVKAIRHGLDKVGFTRYSYFKLRD
ncbi:hypothetical protein [Coxiella-like endosymbiont of Rhipicephalus sanguineus]|nr:hypothetical protein [Coxiella-like endosymbiont of Rhipicephalus sanguineus]